jgi:hypothetical protein
MIWLFVWLGTMIFMVYQFTLERDRVEDEIRSRLFHYVGRVFTEDNLNYAVEESFH